MIFLLHLENILKKKLFTNNFESMYGDQNSKQLLNIEFFF